MNKLNVAVGILWSVLLVMTILYFAVAMVGVAADRSGVQTFYAADIDATCVESFERGRTAMFCFRGDLREGK